MAEQKAKKRKPGIVSRILKWIGLTLLVALIILAFFFRAPWKATTLLIVIFLACTVLPKPARKWFWLSVAAIVLVLIIWVFLPEGDEGWRPYTFDEDLAALEAKYAILTEENAATIYNQLLQDYNDASYYGNLPKEVQSKLPIREPWSDQEHPELLKWLKSRRDTITTLIEASKVEKCRFPIYADFANFSRSNEHRSAIRRWTFLLTTAANNNLGEGRTNEALEKYTAVLQMARHLCQQSTMTDWLVGIAIEALAIEQIKRSIVTTDATKQHLNLIEKSVAEIKHDWSSYWVEILEHEKLFTKNMYGMFYEVNPKGKVRLIRNQAATMRKQWPEDVPPLTYWQRKLIKASGILWWLFMPSTPQKAAELVENEFAKYYQMADANYLWPCETPELTTLYNYNCLPWHFRDMAMPSESLYCRFHDRYLQTIAMRHGIRILVTLRRYKNKTSRWPESLDDIKSLAPAEIFVDPINGNSFVYKLTEENFTLYSKGKNNIDEDGIRRVTFDPNDFKWPKTEEDDILIWPRKTRKTKKEKADDEQQ